MAPRTFQDGRPLLSPRARVAAGWLVAIGLLVGVALTFRILGGDGDGMANPSSSASPDGTSLEVAFGTRLDTATGEVATGARVERFADGDTFAYSVRPAEPPPQTVYVEVRRIEDDEVVQAAAPLGLPAQPTVIAFSLPAANLIAAFGEGRYMMLIMLDPAAEAVARGEFELVAGTPGGSSEP